LCAYFEFVLKFFVLSVLPFSYDVVVADLNAGILFVFGISSMGVYAVILAVGQVILNIRF